MFGVEKSCLWCKHIDLHLTKAGEVTPKPPGPIELECRLGVWQMPRGASKNVARVLLATALECDHYEVVI